MCNKRRLIFTLQFCFAHSWYTAHANFQALSEAALRAVKFNYLKKYIIQLILNKPSKCQLYTSSRNYHKRSCAIT